MILSSRGYDVLPTSDGLYKPPLTVLSEVTELQLAGKTTQFQPSPKLNWYIFALTAGC